MGELFEMSGAVSRRLQRIAELLELSPDEALEFVELFLEFIVSQGLIRSKVINLGKKRFPGEAEKDQ